MCVCGTDNPIYRSGPDGLMSSSSMISDIPSVCDFALTAKRTSRIISHPVIYIYIMLGLDISGQRVKCELFFFVTRNTQ